MLSESKNSAVLQINQVTARFGLCKVKYALQVRYAHFTIGKYQIKDAQSWRVRASQKNLCARVEIKMF